MTDQPTTRNQLIEQAVRAGALAMNGGEKFEVFNPPPTTYREHPIPGYARSILRAALLGICPTLCDDDCETPCHEAHAIPRKRQHDVAECEGRQQRDPEPLVTPPDPSGRITDHGPVVPFEEGA